VGVVSSFAHGAEYQLLEEGVVGVRAIFDTGQPIAGAAVLIFPPGETTAELTTVTDPRGVVCFAPDRPGVWILQIRAEGGHGLRVNLEIDESGLIDSASGNSGGLSTWQKLVMAVCVIWGFAGIVLFFRRRRKVR
jgi:nickel transport protein